MGGRMLADGIDKPPLKPIELLRCSVSPSLETGTGVRPPGRALLFNFSTLNGESPHLKFVPLRRTLREFPLRCSNPAQHLTFCAQLHPCKREDVFRGAERLSRIANP
jgi:hypothetical protein